MDPTVALWLLLLAVLLAGAMAWVATRRGQRLAVREHEVEQLKADFMATVSHEIRTPVTPIKGYADLLRRRGDMLTDNMRDECLAVISDRAAHLARVVDDMLLASRIAGGELDAVVLETVDLGPLVERAADALVGIGREVTVHVPAAAAVAHCDAAQTARVVGVLLANAAAYSDQDSPVTAYIRLVGKDVLIAVQDLGRGIPPDQLERVFDPFHRVEDPLRMTTGGSGLGLYLARRLTTAMGGALTCRSTVGVGSVFTLRLPRADVRFVPLQRDEGPYRVPTA